MKTPDEYRKGYVEGLFKIFHLNDLPREEIGIHYHDFRKMVLLLEGNLFYDIEGSRYELKAGDMVLVDAGELHRPVLLSGPDTHYERIVIYFSDLFFDKYREAELDACYQRIRHGAPHVLAFGTTDPILQPGDLAELTGQFAGQEAVRNLMQECHLVRLLLKVNEMLKRKGIGYAEPITRNSSVRRVMQYLSEHLTEEIDIRQTAAYIHLDPSYLMHLFKAETGSSIMGYVTEKRLFLAQSLIRDGMPAMTAGERSGFGNYSSFYRAYRKRYGCSPGSGVR